MLLLGLLVQEPSVIPSRFALLRCHVPHSARRRSGDDGGRCAIDGKFSVPYDSGGAGFFDRLNRSFILFVKASSTVPA